MMKFSWCLLLLGVLLSGCLKSDKGCPYTESGIIAPASEQQQVEAYLAANNLTAVKHASGMYYQIVNPGSAVKPELCSVVTVGYLGKLANGTVFDQQNIISFDLGRVIEGWKKGLQLIQKGGVIKLYIPPTLGYGAYDVKDANGTVVIPANSMLIFDIEMFDVN
ncbi:MAG TPA: FKBP-type peptidyl-prolyl cis-trans isomerase [Chitinophagaceae bacterium]